MFFVIVVQLHLPNPSQDAELVLFFFFFFALFASFRLELGMKPGRDLKQTVHVVLNSMWLSSNFIKQENEISLLRIIDGFKALI